jgi:hypothetical protein
MGYSADMNFFSNFALKIFMIFYDLILYNIKK